MQMRSVGDDSNGNSYRVTTEPDSQIKTMLVIFSFCVRQIQMAVV